MNDILQYIKLGSLDKVFWIIIGMVITKLIEKLFKSFNEKYMRWKTSKGIDKLDQVFCEDYNIVGLAHAYPYYDNNNIEILDTRKKLFFDCPNHLKEAILNRDGQFEFREDMSLNSQNSFEDLEQLTEINDLTTLIDKHKELVALKFIEKLENNEEIFNGKKFGIYNLITDKVGDEEEAKIRLELFETDYFTHRVLRSIYKELVQNGHQIKDVLKSNELKKFKPFTSSLGINTYIILDNGDLNGKSIVFAKRSKYIGLGSSEGMWHVSMNEGLSITDIDDNEISLHKCLIRGLKEELGIINNQSINKDIRFMDVFLEKNNFEIGIASYVELEMSFDKLKRLYMSAKDAELETDEIKNVKLNKRDISEFINNPDNKFTDTGRYVLAMILNRKNI